MAVEVGVGVNVAVAVAVGVGVTVGVTVAVAVAVGVGEGVPVGVGDELTSSLSVKASCWDAPLMATRPSVHEVTCFCVMADP